MGKLGNHIYENVCVMVKQIAHARRLTVALSSHAER